MQALGIFGTNFQAVADRLNSRMAQQGLSHLRRSRKQVKLKFNKEEKLHPRRIDSTLRGQVCAQHKTVQCYTCDVACAHLLSLASASIQLMLSGQLYNCAVPLLAFRQTKYVYICR